MNLKGVTVKILAFAVFISVSSCSIENKIASESGKYIDGAAILLLFPDDIFVDISKDFQLPDSLNDDERYYASIDSSFFLKNIDAEDFKDRFEKEIISLYRDYGFRVYLKDSLSSFLKLDTTAFVVEFTQFQIEEFWKPYYYEEEMPDGYTYHQEFSLNALGFDAWITISKLNDTTGTNSLIYSEESIADDIDGMFVMNNITGEVNFVYNYTPLKPGDADDLTEKAAIKISLDIVDFIANSYIEDKMLKLRGVYPERFWRYNPGREKLTPVYEKSGYIIME
jgi:hypothetical protein